MTYLQISYKLKMIDINLPQKSISWICFKNKFELRYDTFLIISGNMLTKVETAILDVQLLYDFDWNLVYDYITWDFTWTI